MKKLTLIFAALGLLLCACDKTNEDGKISKEDLIGVWMNTNENDFVSITLKQDGSFEMNYGDGQGLGKWELKTNGVLSYNMGDNPASEVNVKLIGGKNALVVSSEDENFRDVSLLYRQGATIKSGALKDGRYDAPHSGIKGTGNYDRTFTFLVKGNEVDMYIHAWGTHLKGTYTIENGVFKFNITQGWYGYDSVDGGWFAGDADIDFENFSFGNKNYKWYEGIRYQEDFSSFPMCVSDDGKDLYMSAVGTTRWAFLR